MKKIVHYSLALLAYFIWGLTFPFGKMVLPPLSPYSFVSIRTGFGSIVLLLYLGIKKQIRVWFQSLKDNFWILFFYSLIPFTLSYILQFYAITFTTSTNQSILAQTSIIWVILINFLVFKEKPNINFIIAVATALFGVILLITQKGFTISTVTIKGDLLSILAFVSWASYSAFSKPISKKLNPIYSTTTILIFSSIFLVSFAFVSGLPEQLGYLTGIQWGIMIYLGVICTGFAYVIHLIAVSGDDVKTEYVVYTGFIMPIVSTIYSVLFLGDILTWRILIGGFLVIISVVIIQIPGKRKQNTESSPDVMMEYIVE